MVLFSSWRTPRRVFISCWPTELKTYCARAMLLWILTIDNERAVERTHAFLKSLVFWVHLPSPICHPTHTQNAWSLSLHSTIGSRHSINARTPFPRMTTHIHTYTHALSLIRYNKENNNTTDIFIQSLPLFNSWDLLSFNHTIGRESSLSIWLSLCRMTILTYWEGDQLDNQDFAGASLDIYGVQPFMEKRRLFWFPAWLNVVFRPWLFDNTTTPSWQTSTHHKLLMHTFKNAWNDVFTALNLWHQTCDLVNCMLWHGLSRFVRSPHLFACIQ